MADVKTTWRSLGVAAILLAGCWGSDGSDPDAGRCGDGIVQPPEACDDGNTIDDDLCRNDCRTRPPGCGDGVVDPGEDCDDGNVINGDACPNDCTLARCGNGVIEPPEECDPPDTGVCDSSCQGLPFCGDGELEGTEECDDGNFQGGDGCSWGCVLEFCGDGVVNDGGQEQCDDGNLEPGDGCRPDCVLESCGDGTRDPLEECDDGNTTPGDGCSAACRVEHCGDGVVDPGEACDDANATNGDFCTNACGLGSCQDGVPAPSERCYFGPDAFEGLVGASLLRAADLDGDGRPELVAVISDRLAIASLDGAGNPRPPRVVPLGLGVQDLEAGDLDGDGDVDVLVKRHDWTSGASDLVLVRNDGAGALTADAPVATLDYGVFVLADLDGDGDPDLAATRSPGTVGILVQQNLGGGALAAASALPGGVFLDDVAAGDLDGDGDLDLVGFAEPTRTFVAYRNTGGGFGAFATPVTVSLGAVSTSTWSPVLLGDLTGDGLPEAVGYAIGSAAREAVVLRNGGGFAFTAASIPLGSLGEAPALIADLDGDGDRDVLLSRGLESSSGLGRLLNDGAGGLAPGADLWTSSQPSGDVVRLDLDGEGPLDLAYATWNGVDTLLAQSGGALAPRQTFVTSGAAHVALGDLDGDGDLDLAAPLGGADPGVGLYVNEGGGRYAPEARLPCPVSSPEALAIADVDADGDLDLIVAPGYGTRFALLRNDGALTFTGSTFEAAPDYLYGPLLTGDLDGDGAPDLVFDTYNGGRVRVLLGDGAGGVTALPDVAVPVHVNEFVDRMALGDLTGDGAPELVIQTYELGFMTGRIFVAANDGAGRLGAPAVVTQAAFVASTIALGDLDGDGALDLLASSDDDPAVGTVWRLPGNGDGTFGAPVALPVHQTQVQTIAAVDLNGDGRLDVAVAGHYDTDLELLYQTAAGAFVPELTFEVYTRITDLLPADVNGDGVPDLVTYASYDSPHIETILSAP